MSMPFKGAGAVEEQNFCHGQEGRRGGGLEMELDIREVG